MKKILVVDDNDTNLKILSIILAKDEYEVHTTKNAEEVLTKLCSGFDLLLLDINMPKKSGYEICRDMQFDKKLKEIPVIIISALTDSNDIVKAFTCGAVDYITKPFKSEEVRARVKTHLKIHELQQELQETNATLAHKVEEQVKIISETQMETIF